MRRFPVSWDSTLTALGFKRKVKRIKRDHYARKNSRFEPLEVRAMLSGNQPQYHFAVEDDAEYDPATQFVLSTEYDPQTSAPRAVLALRGDLLEEHIETGLQRIELELVDDGAVVQTQTVHVDLAEEDFLEKFRADQVASATDDLKEADTASLSTAVVGDYTLEELLDVSAFVYGRASGTLTGSEAAGYYSAYGLALQDAAGREANATTYEEFEEASLEKHALSAAAVALTFRLQQDLAAPDAALSASAVALANVLYEYGDLTHTAFSGLGENLEIARELREDGSVLYVWALVEEPTFEASDALRVELDGRQGMVQAEISTGLSVAQESSSVHLPESDVQRDTYLNSHTGETESNGHGTETVLKVESNTNDPGRRYALLGFDLSDWTESNAINELPGEVELTLTPTATGGNFAQSAKTSWDSWGLTGIGSWNEETITYDEYLGSLMDSLPALDTQTPADGQPAVFNVTEAVRRAVLAGDSNLDGTYNAISLSGRGDIEAAYLAVRDWELYVSTYGGAEHIENGLLYRNDINQSGTVEASDFKWLKKRHGFLGGDFNLDTRIDIDDYSIWQANYSAGDNSATAFQQGDGDADGFVTFDDWSEFLSVVDANGVEGQPITQHGNPLATSLSLFVAPETDGAVAYYSKEDLVEASPPRLDTNSVANEISLTHFSSDSNLGWQIGYRAYGDTSTSPQLSLEVEMVTADGQVHQVGLPRPITAGPQPGVETYTWADIDLPADPYQDYTLRARLSGSGYETVVREYEGELFVDSNGVWHVHGNDANDNIVVMDAGVRLANNDSNHVHSVNDVEFADWQAAGLDGITIHAGGGRDWITQAWSQALPVWASGGIGDDYFVTFDFWTDADLAIHDPAGFDTVHFYSTFELASITTLDLRSTSTQHVDYGSGGSLVIQFETGTDIEYGEARLGLLSTLLFTGRGYDGAPIVVDSLGSEFDGDLGAGRVELREAIELANQLPGEQTIEFDPGLFGNGRKTIAVGDDLRVVGDYAPLRITDDLSINGHGQGELSIDGEDATGVFDVTQASLTLRDLTVERGSAVQGAGLRLDTGEAHLERVVFRDNRDIGTGHGGAIYSHDSVLTVDDSTLDGNDASYGGAVYFDSALADTGLIIRRSTVSRNSAFQGSGVSVYGYAKIEDGEIPIRVENSTFYANSATQGGALYVFGRNASQMYDSAFNVDVVNSTFARNEAYAGFGAGIFNYSTASVELHNTIVAESVKLANPGVAHDIRAAAGHGHTITGGHNLIGQHYTTSFDFDTATTGNVDLVATGVSAGLIDLDNNGGLTETVALAADSPAIDSGDDSQSVGADSLPLDTDQRGFDRKKDGLFDDQERVDIGAYEYTHPTLANLVNGTVAFHPADDARIVDFAASDTSTDSLSLVGAPDEYGLFRFDTTHQPVIADSVEALLRLWVELPGGSGPVTLQVYAVTTDWNEPGLTNALPGVDGAQLIATVIVSQTGYVEIVSAQLDDYVRVKLDATDAISFAIAADDAVTIRTREHGNYPTRPEFALTGDFYSNIVPSTTGATPDVVADPFFGLIPGRTFTGNVLLNDTDPNGDVVLRAELVSPPKLGTMTLDPTGYFSYRPVVGVSGVDEFTYRVFDGLGWSDAQTARLGVEETRVYRLQESDGVFDLSFLDEATILDAYVEGEFYAEDYYGVTKCYSGEAGECSDPQDSYVDPFEVDSTNLGILYEINGDYEGREFDPIVAEIVRSSLSYAPTADVLRRLRTGPDEVESEKSGQANRITQYAFTQYARHHVVETITDPAGPVLSIHSSLEDQNEAFQYRGHPYFQHPFRLHFGLSVSTLYVTAVVPNQVDDLHENAPPGFTSAPDSTAEVGVEYEYEMTATDRDGDALAFELLLDETLWPEDLPQDYDPVALGHLPEFEQTSFKEGIERAVVRWTPPAALAGKTVTFFERVIDGEGGQETRPIEITVGGYNAPPVIVADPIGEYVVPYEFLPETNLDPVDPMYIDVTLTDGETLTIPVSIDATPAGPYSSQVVFVAHMGAHDRHPDYHWLATNILEIDSALQLAGFTAMREYGLVTFGDEIVAHDLSGPDSRWGSAEELRTKVLELADPSAPANNGFFESPAYDALDVATDPQQYDFLADENNASQIVLLSSFRDKDYAEGTPVFVDDVKDASIAGPVILANREPRAQKRADILGRLTNNPDTYTDDIVLSVITTASFSGALPNDLVNFNEPFPTNGDWERTNEGLRVTSTDGNSPYLLTVDVGLDGELYVGEGAVAPKLARISDVYAEFSLDDAASHGTAEFVFGYQDPSNYWFFATNIVEPGIGHYEYGRVVDDARSVLWTSEEDARVIFNPANTQIITIDSYGTETYSGQPVLAMQVFIYDKSTRERHRVYLPSIPFASGDFTDTPFDGAIGISTKNTEATIAHLGVNDTSPHHNLDQAFDFTRWRGPVGGMDESGRGYLPDGDGGHVEVADSELEFALKQYINDPIHKLDVNPSHFYPDGDFATEYGIPGYPVAETVADDFFDLAFESGGVVWDWYKVVNEVNTGADYARSLAEAFPDVVVEQALGSVTTLVGGDGASPDVQAAIAGVDFVGIEDSPVDSTKKRLTYAVTLVGDGSSRAFDLNFVQSDGSGSDQVIGSIPTVIRSPYSVDFDVQDPDGVGPYRFELVGGSEANHGATLEPSGREGLLNDRLVWTPPTGLSKPTKYRFWVQVTDEFTGQKAVEPFDWSVTAYPPSTNSEAPEVTRVTPHTEETLAADEVGSAPTAQERRAYSIQVHAEDKDGDTPRFHLVDAPDRMTIDRNTGVINWIPDRAAAESGSVDVKIAVTDGRLIKQGHLDGLDESDVGFGHEFVTSQTVFTLPITVSAVETGNRAPSFGTIGHRTLRVGESLLISPDEIPWTDFDGDDPKFYKLSGPDKLHIDEESGAISWTPEAEHAEAPFGRHDVVIQMDDGGDGTDSTWFSIYVEPANYDPTVTLLHEDLSKSEIVLSFPFYVEDRDGHGVTVELADNPDWISQRQIPGSGLYELVVDENGLMAARGNSPGVVDVEAVFSIVAYDDYGGETEYPLALSYSLHPSIPALFEGLPEITRPVGREATYTFSVILDEALIDPLDDLLDILSVDTGSMQRGVEIDVADYSVSAVDEKYVYSDLKLRWTPLVEGEPIIVILATDENGFSNSKTVEVTVTPPVKLAPVLTSNIFPATEGTPWTVTVLADTSPLPANAFGVEDPDGDSSLVTFELIDAPQGMQVVDSGGLLVQGPGRVGDEIVWTPPVGSDDSGPHYVEIAITDADGGKEGGGFHLPVFVSPSTTPIATDPTADEVLELGPYYEGLSYTVPLIDYFEGNLELTFELDTDQTSPELGIASNGLTADGFLTLNPAAVGDDYTLAVVVTDQGTNTSILVKASIDVAPKLSDPPKIDKEGQSGIVLAGQPWVYELPITDDSPVSVEMTLNPEAIAAGIELLAPGELREGIVDERFRGPAAEDGSTYSGWVLVWADPGPVGTIVDVSVEINDPGAYSGTFHYGPLLRVYDPTDEATPQELPASLTVPAGRVYRFNMVSNEPGAEEAVVTATLELPNGDAADSALVGLRVEGTEIVIEPPVDPTWFDIDSASFTPPAYKLKIEVGGIDNAASPEIDLTIEKPDPQWLSQFRPTIDRSVAPWAAAPASSPWYFAPTGTVSAEFGGAEWTLDAGPEGAAFNPLLNRIEWTPDADKVGERHDFELRLSDAIGGYDVVEFSVLVTAENKAPVIGAVFPQAWPEETPLSVPLRVRDPEGRPLQYEVLDLSGAVLDGAGDPQITDAGSGPVLSWTTPSGNVETSFIVRVSEVADPSIYLDEVVTIQVTDSPAVDWLPIIQGSTAGLVAFTDDTFTHEFGIFDANGFTDFDGAGDFDVDLFNGETLAVADGVTFVYDEPTQTATFSWTPPPTVQEGLHSFRLYADNANNVRVYHTFNIEVVHNEAPEVIAPPVLEVVQGARLVERMTARDPEGGGLVYALRRVGEDPLPVGMSVNATTGELRWEAGVSAPGSLNGFELVVTDEAGRDAVHPFQIDVLPDTVAPTISFRIEDKTTGQTVLPSESLDASRPENYRLWFEIRDNADDVDDVTWSLLSEDSASLNGGSMPVEFDDPMNPGGLWSADFVSPSNVGSLNPMNQGNPNYGLNQGLLQFTLTANDNSSNSVTQTFNYYVDDPNNRAARIESDLSAVIEEETEILGVANHLGGSFSVKLTSLEDETDFVWIVEDNNDATIATTGLIATIDPSLIRSGTYRLYLEVRCGLGCLQAIDERIVEIRNDSRLGNLDLSFTDLQADLGGIPVSVVRSYSSSLVGEKASAFGGDFGPGWTLNFLQAGVSVSHPDQVTQDLGQPIAEETRVSVELPDGSIERFSFAPAPVYGDFGVYQPGFRPAPDSSSTLELAGQSGLRLRPDDERRDGTYVEASSSSPFSLSDFASELVLTTRSGVRYVYDSATGELVSIEDQNDRAVEITRTYNDDATKNRLTSLEVASSTSPGEKIVVEFEDYGVVVDGTTGDETIVASDDANADRIESRISRVIDPKNAPLWTHGSTDPNIAAVEYAYGDYDGPTPDDGFAGLGTVTSPTGETTTYLYREDNFDHHLTGILDPGGVPVLTADYYDYDDPDVEERGRLLDLIDAGGQSADVEFVLKLPGGLTRTVVTNNDVKVEEVRNNRGDVKRRIQHLNDPDDQAAAPKYLVSVYRHDNQGRVTAESLPFVVDTAEAGVEIEHRLSIEPPSPEDDPSVWARVTEYVYKENEKHGGALVASTRDASGGLTLFEYDDHDRVIQTTDPSGSITHNVYDATSGDLLETYVTGPDDDTKHNHSRFEYHRGRVTATYQIADGVESFVSQTYYDPLTGRVAWTAGRVAETSDGAHDYRRYFHYDANGAQTHSWTNWTDGVDRVASVSETEYDDAGRVTFSREYEVAGQPADGAFTDFATLQPYLVDANLVSTTATVYDDQGRVEHTEDRFGAKTFTTYDVRGAVLQTASTARDNANNLDGWLVTRTLYDAQGRVVFVTDPYFVAGGYNTDNLPDIPPISAAPTAEDPGLGVRTLYDHLGRVEHTERWTGVRIDLVIDSNLTLGGDQSTTTTPIDFTDITNRLSHSETHYDDYGRVLASVTESGTRTDYYYDHTGRQIAVLGPEASVDGAATRHLTVSVFDNAGRLTESWANIALDNTAAPDHPALTIIGSKIDAPAGLVDLSQARVTRYEYDALGRQTAVITTLVDHDQDPTTDRVHLRTETEYDSLGRRVSTTAGVIHGDWRNPATVDKGDARTTRFEYNDEGTLTAVTLPAVEHASLIDHHVDFTDGLVKEIETVDFAGFPVFQAAVVSPRYEYVYDDYGNRVALVDNIAVTEDGRILRDHDDYHDPSLGLPDDNVDEARTTEFTFDHRGRQLTRRLALGVADADGTFTERMAYGVFSLAQLDAAGQLASSASNDQLAYSVDFEGRVTRYLYDNTTGGGGRLVEKRYYQGDGAADGDLFDEAVGSAEEIVTYRYDVFGRQTEVAIDRNGDGDLLDPVDHVTTNAYDPQGRLTRVSTTEGGVTSHLHYDYDLATGEQVRAWTTAAADPASNVITDTRYAYDGLGRLETVVSAVRNGTDLGDAGPADDVNWTNAQGVVESIDGDVTTYDYDLSGALRRTTLDSADHAHDVVTDHAFDELGRLVEQRNFVDENNDGAYTDENVDRLLGRYAYTHDAHGKRTSLRETDDQGVETAVDWYYDDLGRLVAESYDYDTATAPSPASGIDHANAYDYDLVGNRVRFWQSSRHSYDSRNWALYKTVTEYDYDANDRLLREAERDLDAWNSTTDPPPAGPIFTGGGETTFYDYHGLLQSNDGTRQTAKRMHYDVYALGAEPSITPIEETTYTYNLRGRLEQVVVVDALSGAGNSDLSYTYDDDGYRVSVTDGGSTTVHVADAQNPTGYTQVLEERDAGSPQPDVLKTYVLGHDVLLQETHSGAGGAASYRLLADGHGSTRALLRTSNNGVVQRYAYDAYGVMLDVGGAIDSAAAAFTPILFAGEAVDKNGLGYNRARHLDFATGRWLTLDPFFGNLDDPQSLHKYVYVHGDPVNGVDPTGWFYALGSALTSLGRNASAAKFGVSALNFAGSFQDAVDIGQIALQFATTGSVNPYKVAEVAFGLLPGSGILRRIQSLPLPLGRNVNVRGTLNGATEFLTHTAHSLDRYDVGLDIVNNRNGALAAASTISKRSVQKIGEMGNGLVARQLGLTRVKGFRPRYHGIDQIYEKNGIFYIAEAKGGTSGLQPGQFTKGWIDRNLDRIGGDLGVKLREAFDEKNLYGLVTETPIDRTTGQILNPSYTLMHINNL